MNYSTPQFRLFVPKLCLGMSLSRQLCCPSCETEFRRQLRSQTEFGNEEDKVSLVATALWAAGSRLSPLTQTQNGPQGRGYNS
jgi:hypothetical protein